MHSPECIEAVFARVFEAVELALVGDTVAGITLRED